MERASDIANAEKLVFPGVGAFGQAMKILQERGYTEALKDYIQVRQPGLGSACGMVLFRKGGLVKECQVNIQRIGPPGSGVAAGQGMKGLLGKI